MRIKLDQLPPIDKVDYKNTTALILATNPQITRASKKINSSEEMDSGKEVIQENDSDQHVLGKIYKIPENSTATWTYGDDYTTTKVRFKPKSVPAAGPTHERFY